MTKGSHKLYGILPGNSGAPTVLVKPAVAQACGVAVDDAIDVVHRKVNWEKFSFYLPLVVPRDQTTCAHLCCLKKKFRGIEEGPCSWSMKHQLLAAQFSCAIARQITKN